MRNSRERPSQGGVSIRVTIVISLTISLLVIVSVIVAFLVFLHPSQAQQGSGSGPTAQSTPSSSSGTTQGSCLNKIGGQGISQGQTFTTDPNLWIIFRGDVSYVDPNTSSQMFVKSANGDDPNASDVGSLLAVHGTITIYGVNQAGYDLYPGGTSVDQIKQELTCDKNIMLNVAGCQGKCRAVSEVLIDGKAVMLLGG